MATKRGVAALFAIGAAAATLSPRLSAQAFTAPAGVGQITLGWQLVDNTGHRFSDGFLLSLGDSVTKSLLVEIDYGVTDRLSASASIPYVFAKYTGALPPASRLPVDACQCWHSSFQDFSFATRYRFGNDIWAITPGLRYTVPSHDYRHEGEAVVGRKLQEMQVNVSAGRRLSGLLRKADVQTSYAYSFVETPIKGISIDRSNASFDLGYALTDRLSIRGNANWQHTHGGLRVGSPTGNPCPFPCDLNTPERYVQRDRLLRTEYWQAGGGLSYALGPIDVFVSYTQYIWGRNAHDGHVYTAGATWYFDRWQ